MKSIDDLANEFIEGIYTGSIILYPRNGFSGTSTLCANKDVFKNLSNEQKRCTQP